MLVLVAAMCLLLGATEAVSSDDASPSEPPVIHFDYPRDQGTIFSLPRVLLIFDVEKAGWNPDRIQLKVDGRTVPKEAVAGCAICAGPRPALLASKVPWALTDGPHTAVITVSPQGRPAARSEIHYTVDSTVPSLSGLSGFVEFPDAQVASSKSLRGGFVDERHGDLKLWLAATRLLEADPTMTWARPFEFGVTARFLNSSANNPQTTQKVDYSLKVQLREQGARSPAFSAGLREGDPFAVIGWRSEPATWNLAAGIGGSDLPGGFVGASWGPEIFRLIGEYGAGGRFDYGLVLYHPYGVRAGVYRVDRGGADRRWEVQLSGSYGF